MTEWLDFKTFLFIYLANADLELSAEEEDYIKNGIEENTYRKHLSLFNNLSDLQALNFIIGQRSIYFENEAKKRVLLNEIKQFFQIDGDYSILERDLYILLDKMM